MADAYAGATTYADRGRARSLHVSPSSRSDDRESFATYLDRRVGFRFEGARRRPVIVRLAPRSPQIPTDPLLSPLILGRFGLTMTSAPMLLLSEQFCRGFVDNLRDAEVLGSEDVDGLRCHRLRGHWREQRNVTLWVDERHFLLRRQAERTDYLFGTEAAKLREEHLRRRDHALAAGVSRKVIDQAFGPGKLLAIEHWPYATPREDSHTFTRISYQPSIGVPIDPALFR
jgi:hypothetical protein